MFIKGSFIKLFVAITLTPYTQGKLTFVTGPVNSDKAGLLERTLDAARDSGYKTESNILVFRHPRDSPHPERMGSHEIDAVTDSVPVILNKIKPETRNIFIAGASLFENPNIVDLVDALVRSNRNVIISGLNLDANGKPFGHSAEFMALADEVVLARAFCSKCHDLYASRSTLTESKFEAVCVHHFHYSSSPPISPRNAGSLTLDVGPMFSGKTTSWERRMKLVNVQGINPIVLKPLKDNRYGQPEGEVFGQSNVTLHSGGTISATDIRTTSHIRKFLRREENKDKRYVFLEEAQFVPDLYDLTFELLPQGYKLFYAGLARGFNRKPFNDIPKLMCLADAVEMHYATCVKCGHPAPESQRIKTIDGQRIPARYDDKLELAGGIEGYEARCLGHWELPGEPENPFNISRYSLELFPLR